jgi:hypothetical protein
MNHLKLKIIMNDNWASDAAVGPLEGHFLSRNGAWCKEPGPAGISMHKPRRLVLSLGPSCDGKKNQKSEECSGVRHRAKKWEMMVAACP